MRLFAGLDRTDYQDIFRAVGALIRGFAHFRLIELEDGLLLQAWDAAQKTPRFEMQRFTDEQLQALLHSGYQRRGTGSLQRHRKYQDILRAVGQMMDTRGWHDARVVSYQEGLILQVRTSPSLHSFETYLLTHEELQSLLREVKPPSVT